VARDIFLDGNPFADSHRVDKEPFVSDFAAGSSLVWGKLELSFAKALRTRAYRGQPTVHRFGSISLSFSD